MRRDELQELAAVRLREAQALLDAGLWSGAYYLSGYAVELALKACIARQFRAETIPDPRIVRKIWTHDLNELVGLAKLDGKLAERRKAKDNFEENWSRVARWSEAARYEINDESKARLMLAALTNPDGGVFEWIRSNW